MSAAAAVACCAEGEGQGGVQDLARGGRQGQRGQAGAARAGATHTIAAWEKLPVLKLLVLTVRLILSSAAPSQKLILARGRGREERKAEGANSHLPAAT